VRIVLDTNVFVSAVFFGGVPGRILEAWRDGRLQLVLSAAVLDEYQRVGQVLSAQYEGMDLEPILLS
jgi:predicted nucleic acid-binding protein